MPTCIYIHVPFCKSKCAYCDFYSVPDRPELAARYVLALRREMQLRATGEADTVFLGGGTPSILPQGSLMTLLDCLGEHARILPGAEVTVEANPDTCTEAFLDEAVQAGVSRLSLGVQTLSDSELCLLGRAHTAWQAREVLGLIGARKALSLSVDLIYGIPGQSIDHWRRTLQGVMEFSPAHISAYELTIEPDTVLHDEVRRGLMTMPAEDDVAAMYEEASRFLSHEGYEHYEVSNYARQGMRCRHNMNYWRRGEYIGLGPGAVSFTNGIRSKNIPDVLQYCRALEAGELPAAESEEPGPQDAAREFLMLGLRTADGIAIDEAVSRYGLAKLQEAADSLRRDGLMESHDQRLTLSPAGMPIMNSVLLRLLKALNL